MRKLINIIIWIIAIISVLFNTYFETKLDRLQEENNRLKEQIVGGTNL